MVRFKFLVFTVVVVCAWVGQLVLSAPVHAEGAVNEALRRAELAGRAALARVDAAAALTTQVALGAATTPGTLSFAKGSKLTPSERLTQLRTGVLSATGEQDRSGLGSDFLFAFVSADGQVMARGSDGAVEPTPEGLDLSALAASGARASIVQVRGTAHAILALPVSEAGSAESAPKLGTLLVGAPIAAGVLADAPSPMALLEGEKVLAVGGLPAGSESRVQQWLSALGSAQKGIVERSALDQLGPVLLPLFTAGDAMGGKAVRMVAARQSLGDNELVTFASVDGAQRALASEQKKSLMTLAGLLAFALVWTLLMGGGARSSASAAAKKGNESQDEAQAPVQEKAESPVQEKAQPSQTELAAADPLPSQGPTQSDAFAPPEASPDDFSFGTPAEASSDTAEASAAESSNDSAEAPAAAAPADDGFGDFPFPPAPPSAYEQPADALNASELVAASHSIQTPAPIDSQYGASSFPFGSSDSAPLPPMAFPEDDNPEATRVAAVPAELLAAAAQMGGSGEHLATARGPSAGLLQSSAPSVASAANPDEAHFQDVFREFLETRERCGEMPDSLTFEKFAAKLRKNKDQLMLKHNCKTVRFQVYVKEGKAALKATPVAR